MGFHLAARENGAAIRKAAVIVVAGVLATTLAQPGVLGLIPLKNLLKNELHADRAATSAFFFLIGIPWYVKPVTGILTDAFPLFGRRRKSYLLLSALVDDPRPGKRLSRRSRFWFLATWLAKWWRIATG